MREFKESQKFNQWWLWIINLVIFIGLILQGINVFELTENFLAFIGPAIMALTMILLATLDLRTTISENGVEAKFWPFGRRRIFRSEIAQAKVRKKVPLLELGGWGYRIRPGRKTFNMYGRDVLELTLTDGEIIQIGTQRTDELAGYIAGYLDEGELELTDEAVSLELERLKDEDLLER